MLVKDFFLMCANGVKVAIEERESRRTVFEGVIGSFAKCNFFEEKIAWISTRGDVILLIIE